MLLKTKLLSYWKFRLLIAQFANLLIIKPLLLFYNYFSPANSSQPSPLKIRLRIIAFQWWSSPMQCKTKVDRLHLYSNACLHKFGIIFRRWYTSTIQIQSRMKVCRCVSFRSNCGWTSKDRWWSNDGSFRPSNRCRVFLLGM